MSEKSTGQIVRKLFTLQRYQLHTNIIHGPRQIKPISPNVVFTSGGSSNRSINGNETTDMGDKSLASYYSLMDQASVYEDAELTETIISIYKEYISNYLVKDNTPVTIKEPRYQQYEDIVNKVFDKLDIVGETVNNLDKIIYFGSYSFAIRWDEKERTMLKAELSSPYNVVNLTKNGKLINRIVRNEEGNLILIPPYSVVRIGVPDIQLTNDMNQDYVTDLEVDPLMITREYKFTTSRPMYYGVMDDVKEYLLKDKLISLLSIKDLIQPLLMLVNVDKGTDPTKAAELAQNIEKLINSHVDASQFLSQTFSVQELIDALINNIRVLPDYNGSVRDMGTVDLSKITDKISQMRSEIDTDKEDILNAKGIPLDLFVGRATKFEAIKTSERLNSKINHYINFIKASLQQIASDFVYLYKKERVPPQYFNINIFSKTVIDYNNEIQNSEIISSLMDQLKRILEDAETFATASKLVDKEKYMEFVRNSINNISPELSELMTDEVIEKFIEDLNKPEDGEEGGLMDLL